MDLPSKDQSAFLLWLDKNGPKTLRDLFDAEAPGFTEQRVSQMYADGWLDRKFDVTNDGETIAVYSLSDRGRALIELLAQQEAERAQRAADQEAAKALHAQERREDQANEERWQRKMRRATIWSGIIGAAVGSMLTLLIEHLIFFGC